MVLLTFFPSQSGKTRGVAATSSGGKRLDPNRKSLGGKGLGHGGKGSRRHRKILRDNIQGITKGDIRRMARRGGVKRISSMIYDDIRAAMKDRLSVVLKDVVCFLEHADRKTVTVTDVIFALRRLGTPIYGFDKGTYTEKKSRR
ncbi:MAG: Histone H4 [Thelocarpon superellum]|nr:MAG: Histone H4 [Thelocarpon superellum]